MAEEPPKQTSPNEFEGNPTNFRSPLPYEAVAAADPVAGSQQEQPDANHPAEVISIPVEAANQTPHSDERDHQAYLERNPPGNGVKPLPLEEWRYQEGRGNGGENEAYQEYLKRNPATDNTQPLPYGQWLEEGGPQPKAAELRTETTEEAGAIPVESVAPEEAPRAESVTEEIPRGPQPDRRTIKINGSESLGSVGEIGIEDDSPKEMSPERQQLFRSLPERNRSVLRRMYDKVAEQPELRRVVGKLEIAYNQYFLDRQQERSVKIMGELSAINGRLEGLEEAKSEIEASIAELQKDGLPGAEALQMSIQKLDGQRNRLLAERNRVQTAFEEVVNKSNLLTTKRDAVADKLIMAYDKELMPMEAELEALQTGRDQMELVTAVAEAKHEEMAARIDSLQQRRDKVANAMRAAGVGEKDIRKATEAFDDRIYDVAEQIKHDKEIIAARKLEIDERIARVDAMANPYRDKRDEFTNIKNRRPLNIETEVRTRELAFEGSTPTVGHPRAFAEEGAANNNAETPVTIPEADPRPNVSSYVSQWNEHLSTKGIEGARPVEVADFTSMAGINESTKLNTGQFRKILAAYLKFRKVPQEQYAEALNDFLTES